MKTLLFREMTLASFLEKKGRKIKFHPTATIIRGENETGKSSLIKSLFMTFGAQPTRVHPTWKSAGVRSLVKFEVDGSPYRLLRHGGMFAAFDSRDQLLGRFTSVTNELGPFLARLFGFGLRLPDREGKFVPLPPAFFFLPYYMDQDGSWSSQWAGFAGLQQFSYWKKGLIEYHAGIRGNDYYEAQAAKLDAEASLATIDRRRSGLQEVYTSLSARFEQAQFDVDFDAYRIEVEELLTRCEHLRQKEEEFKARLSDLRNERGGLKTQLDITLHAREEARKDYEYALQPDLGEEVHCPTCGAGYSNSFAERFAIAVDEDQCADLALRLSDQMNELDRKIQQELRGFKGVAAEMAAVEKLLARREGEIALGDLIRHEGRRELRLVMRGDLDGLDAEASALRMRIEDSGKRMRSLDSRERRKRVNSEFEGYMRSFLAGLDAQGIEERSIQKVDGAINATGSELPRALLAYKMAFFHVARVFGSAATGPFVVDSPNQQDQDVHHFERILDFVNRRRPAGTQLLLGLVSTGGNDFGGDEIVLDRKHSVLLESEFREAEGELTHYFDLALAHA